MKRFQSDAGGKVTALDLTLPETMRDLDLNRIGFQQEALKLPVQVFKNVLKRDDLKCRDEDSVLDLLLNYLTKEKERFTSELRKALMPMIRLDHLSKERLIELA